jgi:N-acetylglucosamine kinase-like BadF-type ATPase
LQAADAGSTNAVLAAVQNAWSATSREEIVRIANASPMPNFAALFPQILHAAENGDAVALEILNSAGAQLAKLGLTVVRKLWPDAAAAIRIAGAGGVLANSAHVREAMRGALVKQRPGLVYKDQVIEPVLGAIYLARNSKPASAKSV